MSSLVQELQAMALDQTIPVAELLKRCLVVATKLNISEFADWSRQELDGYKDTNVPEYRIVHGDPQVFNPYRGYLPLHCADSKFKVAISKMHFNQPIEKIESDLRQTEKSGPGAFQITYSPEFEKELMDSINLGLRPSLRVNASELHRLLGAIKKITLEWSLKLESDGIIGEGLSFSKEEKEKAQTVTYNIRNYVHGEFKGSQIQIDTVASNQHMEAFDIQKLKEVIAAVRDSINDFNIGDEEKKELVSELGTLDSQAESPKPKTGIISESLLSIRRILEGAGGNLTGSGILQQIGNLFGA